MNETAQPLVNGSENTSNASSGVVVEQGPEWLVELGYGGPSWLQVVLFGVAVGIVVLAAIAYRRNGLPLEVVREMTEIGTIVLGIAATTNALVKVASLPYIVDVIGGTVLGFLGAKGILFVFWRSYENSRQFESNYAD